jgi:hypothetical protein
VALSFENRIIVQQLANLTLAGEERESFFSVEGRHSSIVI